MTTPQLLLTPRDGVPDTIDTHDALAEAIRVLAAGRGPVAVDAERASGYRYSNRAYLIQLRRAGAGTLLIDPLPFDGLHKVAEALADAEWIIHAAGQDLPSLSELGMRPHNLFDTELAGRLAGFPRVGLASMVSNLLGYELKKSHSAVDWSTRPLPMSWLNYAALDVELLIELRDALATELTKQDKLHWAQEEFAAIVAAPPPTPRAEPWRRTSGIHQVRTTRGLARVRALWEARDTLAQRRDVAPARVLPDAAIVAAAQADPTDERELLAISAFAGRTTRRHTATWLHALRSARELSESSLPTTTVISEGPPPAHRWADKDPVAAERLSRARQTVTQLAESRQIPPENLLAPDTLRRLAWSPPDDLTPASVTETLATLGARDWQISVVALELFSVLTAESPAQPA